MSTALAAAYAHCETRLREHDPDGWLAALFAPAQQRPFLHALGAFFTEIEAVRARAHTPLAGEVRLQWWYDVLVGEARGDVAGNPVATALLDTLTRSSAPRGRVLDTVEAFRIDLWREDWAETREFEDFLDRTRGAAVRLAADILAGAGTTASAPARHAAIAQGIAGTLASLPGTIARGGRIDLPADLLARHGVALAEVRAAHNTPKARAALADWRALARTHLLALRSQRDAIPVAAAPTFLTASLVEPRLRASGRTGNPFANPPAIAPWRRHWILWRAAKRGGVP